MIGVRQKSPCTRAIRKPHQEKEEDFIPADEQSRLADSIEVCVDKLAIADKVFSIMKKEEEESRLGANEQEKQLTKELYELRAKLRTSLLMEMKLIQKTLRSRRDLQLSIYKLSGEDAYHWLEDQWFEQRKELDMILYDIYEKRKQMADSEKLVVEIEHFPLPGSLVWERVYLARMASLELMIQSMRIKKELAALLLQKYTEMRELIVGVIKNYSRTVPEAEDEMIEQKSELKRLEEALALSEEYLAMEKLELSLTEKEAEESRKQRAEQLQRLNEKEAKHLAMVKNANSSVSRGRLPFEMSHNMTKDAKELEAIRQRIQQKQQYYDAVMKQYDELTRIAHVPTLSDVPKRFIVQKEMFKLIQTERSGLDELLQVLLRQKDQLLKIQSHLKYTGADRQKLTQRKLSKLTKKLATVNKVREKKVARVNKRTNRKQTLILLAIATLRKIRECRPYEENKNKPDRIPELPAADTATLEKLFQLIHTEGSEIRDRYIVEMKLHDTSNDAEIEAWLDEEEVDPVEDRLIRVETPVVENENEDYFEIDFISFSVPGRTEIKNENKKFVEDAIYHKEMGQRCE